MPLRRAWLPLLTGVALACGDDATEPDLEVYRIAVTPTNTETLPDGTVRHVYQVLVTDGGNLRIAGAWMLFTVTTGDVTPQTDRTDLQGHGRVEWTLEPGDIAGVPSATLSGCAQNLAPPDCTPEPLVTLTFD